MVNANRSVNAVNRELRTRVSAVLSGQFLAPAEEEVGA
jgi:hypothetical protein